MRKLGVAILLLVVAAFLSAAVAYYRHPAGKRVYGYHESPGNGTNEPNCFFLVGDFRPGLHMGPCGIGEAVNWSYHIYLSGAGERFPFEKVDVSPDALGQERPVAGEVVLDRQKNLVTISLKVARGKGMEDFIGNGTFDFQKWP
jgi:hypothetical protein